MTGPSADWTSGLGARFYRNASPTAAMYFEWSSQQWLANRRAEKLSPTVFRVDGVLIVLRHLSGLISLPEHDALIYVIDDDWRAGLRDRGLPFDYRAKLGLVEARAGKMLENKATVIAVASHELERRYRARFPTRDIVLLEPVWPVSDTPLAQQSPATIACLSARSHANDLGIVVPAIDGILRAHANVQITISGNMKVPGSWRSSERVAVLPPASWPEYLSWMRGQKFDVLIYPTHPGRFNAARSRNKLFEADQFGAALLASDNWQPGLGAQEEGRCLSAANTADDWLSALRRLLTEPGLARSLAARNRHAIGASDPVGRQSQLWRQMIDRLIQPSSDSEVFHPL